MTAKIFTIGGPVWEDDESAEPTQPHVRAAREDEGAWRSRLIMTVNKQGEPTIKAIAANVASIFKYHPAWNGVIAYDAFAECVVTLKPAPWHEVDAPSEVHVGEWTDADTARAVNWLARVELLNVGAQVVEAALTVVSSTRVVHPVRDWLTGLTWDGTERLETMLPRYFRTLDTPYTRGVGRRWVVSLVARIFQPGVQSDCTLILESRTQGTGKTSAFRNLVPVPGWYQDSGIDLSNKDSFIALRNVWVFGLDELDSLRKGDITKWKNFLSATRDHYRPPYARRAKDFPRQCGFCGTSNESEYLSDRSGNRRFWPVRVIGEIDPTAIVLDRDQLWGEAVARYRAGEKWHVDTAEFRAMCESEQADRVCSDPWLTIVANWLAEPFEVHQEENERGHKVSVRYPYAPTTPGVLTEDVIRYGLAKDKDRITVADHMRVAACLRELGYERGKLVSENGARVRRYQLVTTYTTEDSKGGAA